MNQVPSNEPYHVWKNRLDAANLTRKIKKIFKIVFWVVLGVLVSHLALIMVLLGHAGADDAFQEFSKIIVITASLFIVIALIVALSPSDKKVRKLLIPRLQRMDELYKNDPFKASVLALCGNWLRLVLDHSRRTNESLGVDPEFLTEDQMNKVFVISYMYFHFMMEVNSGIPGDQIENREPLSWIAEENDLGKELGQIKSELAGHAASGNMPLSPMVKLLYSVLHRDFDGLEVALRVSVMSKYLNSIAELGGVAAHLALSDFMRKTY